MFFFKSLLTRVFLLAGPAVSLFALFSLFRDSWVWMAVLLAWLPFPLLQGYRTWVGNIAFRDERELPALLLALIGVGGVLVLGERGAILWWTLAGLFSLLLHNVVLSSIKPSVREAPVQWPALQGASFDSVSGQSCGLSEWGPCLVVFAHAGWSPYARMQLRELAALRATGSVAKVMVFPGVIPAWARRGRGDVVLLADPDSVVGEQMGLALRGGAAGFGGLAQRPAVVVLDSEQLHHHQVAVNYRQPPSIADVVAKFKKWWPAAL